MEFEFKAEATLVRTSARQKRRQGNFALTSSNLSSAGNNILVHRYWDLLLLKLKSDEQRETFVEDKHTLKWKVTVTVSNDEHERFQNIMDVRDDREKGMFRRLHDSLGENEYKVGIYLNVAVSGEPDFKMGFAFDMESGERGTTKDFAAIVARFNDHPDWRFEKLWDTEAPLNTSLKVKFQLSGEALDILRLNGMKDPMKINRKILADMEFPDALIIPGDGEAVPCHKIFLIAQSPAFRAMFKYDTIERSTNTLELVDMTEAGVRALITYLYTWELAGASGNAAVAMELLLAADKYETEKLEEDVRELILSKKPAWFTVNDAELLQGFAEAKLAMFENVPDEYKLLREKAEEVLKSKSTDEVNECEVNRGLELLNVSGPAGALL